MTKSTFDKIAAGLKDATTYAAGDKTRVRVVEPLNVRAIRQATQKTQAEFSSLYHIPVGTLREWEEERRQPNAPAHVLLRLIRKDPERIARMLAN